MKTVRDHLDDYNDNEIIAPKLGSMDGTEEYFDDILEYTVPKDITEKNDEPHIIAVAHCDDGAAAPVVSDMYGNVMSEEDIRSDALMEAEPPQRTELFPQQPKPDLYEGRQYKDNLGLFDEGEKIAKVVGIIVIIISSVAVIKSFISGGLSDFLVAAMRIAAAIMFIKGFDWGRIMLAVALAISFYGPFVLFFVTEIPAPLYMQFIYIALMILYLVLEYFVCLNKDVRTYFRR